MESTRKSMDIWHFSCCCVSAIFSQLYTKCVAFFPACHQWHLRTITQVNGKFTSQENIHVLFCTYYYISNVCNRQEQHINEIQEKEWRHNNWERSKWMEHNKPTPLSHKLNDKNKTTKDGQIFLRYDEITRETERSTQCLHDRSTYTHMPHKNTKIHTPPATKRRTEIEDEAECGEKGISTGRQWQQINWKCVSNSQWYNKKTKAAKTTTSEEKTANKKAKRAIARLFADVLLIRYSSRINVIRT